MTAPSTPSPAAANPTDLLVTGRSAIDRWAWTEGRDLLTAALAADESPETLESLAVATFWTRDVARAVELRQRAYRLYLERGDHRSAARVATGLALDFEHHLGETAVASGWKERAARLLEDVEPCAEHAWLTLWRAHHAIVFHNEVERGRDLLDQAIEMARRLALPDVDLMARGLRGFTLVTEGQLEAGMRFLDEAATAAIAGELRDPEARGSACCYVLSACEQVLDLVRAAQWHRQVRERYEERTDRLGLTFCRRHYVYILLWAGEWREAEAEIERLRAETPPEMHVLAVEAKMLLGELRRRQGRRDEALAIFEEEAGHPRSLLGRAAIELDAGRPAAALRFAQRYLRQLGDPVRSDHLPGRWLVVRAACAAGEVDLAAAAAADVETLAKAVGTPLVSAFAAAARGLVARARGDHEAARSELEDAIAIFERSAAPFETAHARLDLAETLCAAGDAAGAALEIRPALAELTRLGAEEGVARARRLLATAGADSASSGAPVALPLTTRELEVLRLLAQGLSNADIAARLGVSAHTVKRHVANLLGKLDLPTRAAAAALAVRSGLS